MLGYYKGPKQSIIKTVERQALMYNIIFVDLIVKGVFFKRNNLSRVFIR